LLLIAACSSSAHHNSRTYLSSPLAAARSAPGEIPDELAIGEWSRHAQRSWEGPAAPGSLQAVLTGVQIGPPAGSARHGIDDNLAVSRHDTEQVGLGGSDTASYARADHCSLKH
jgi:hypothetical protein